MTNTKTEDLNLGAFQIVAVKNIPSLTGLGTEG